MLQKSILNEDYTYLHSICQAMLGTFFYKSDTDKIQQKYSQEMCIAKRDQ